MTTSIRFIWENETANLYILPIMSIYSLYFIPDEQVSSDMKPKPIKKIRGADIYCLPP